MRIRCLGYISLLACFGLLVACGDNADEVFPDEPDAMVPDAPTEPDAPVEPVNIAPVVTSVLISPELPTIATDLTAEVQAIDADGDEVTLRYEWSKDSVLTAFTSATILATELSKGDVWEVRVTPNDGKIDGIPQIANVTIGNTAPSGGSVAITPTTATETTILGATIILPVDADGDTVTVNAYDWYVDNLLVGEGETLDGTSFAAGQEVRLEVQTTDGTSDGPVLVSQSVTILNTPPTASVVLATANPADGYQCVLQFSDVDGDVVQYSINWFVDGQPYTGAITTVTYTGDYIVGSPLLSGHNVSCRVPVTDGAVGAPIAQYEASTDVLFDFVVANGSTVTLPNGNFVFSNMNVSAGAQVNIGQIATFTAPNIAIGGIINGRGRGEQSGPLGASGNGPGAGNSSVDTGASGAGHGGLGGDGASASVGGVTAIGGAIYDGFDDFSYAQGSSGGSSADAMGGRGGSGVAFFTPNFSLNGGVIDMDANDGQNGEAGGGGGSGGSILISADVVTLNGVMNARGGRGGDGNGTVAKPGGGGAGGRIKILGAPAITFGASVLRVDPGQGGGLPGFTAPNGEIGTIRLPS